MGRRTYSYIRVNRRRWGLTQAELAFLIGLSGAPAVSHIERASRPPSVDAMVACASIFGIAAHELLPALHRDIEANVVNAARILLEALEDQTDGRSRRVRKLLDDVISRLTSQVNPPVHDS